MPFLQALKHLKRPYVLHVYGGGNELKKAKRYAERNNLKVKFYGPVKREKIIERMKEAHLSVVVSYNFDVQPMTLLEAEATGLPVFFCDPTMREVVAPGGYVMADGPSAVAMQLALDNLPSGEITAMSKRMLTHRGEVLQAKQMKKLLDVYNEAIGYKKIK